MKTASIVFAAVIAILALVELGGRFTISLLESRAPSGILAENLLSHHEPVLGFGLKKNLQESMGNWRVATNAFGFRDDEPLLMPKPKDEIRIFVVGGSTVFGWGVDEAKAIPGQLQKVAKAKLSNPSGKKFRVINAGVPWYASWHEVALIFFRLLPLSPDLIVVLDGLNDTAMATAANWMPIHLGYVDTPTRIAFERRKSSESIPIWETAINLSPSFRYFRARLQAKRKAYYYAKDGPKPNLQFTKCKC